MKRSSVILAIILIINLLNNQARSQEKPGFGFDPYIILKTWTYDILRKNMGEGEPVMATMRNQSYLAGLRYPFEMIGISGKLEFTFAKDSIRLIQFRKQLPERKIGPDIADRIIRDTTFRKEYNRSIQQADSLRRDSLVRSITLILGKPVSMGKTSSTEKNAKYSAVWVNHGYSCLYKEFLGFEDIVFTVSAAPAIIVSEFMIPASTEIIQKLQVNTKKMSWTASLLATPAIRPRTAYTDYFILLEFTTGQRYLESIPKNPGNYLLNRMFLEFTGGRRFLMDVPNAPTGYLPDLQFDDLDGDAIPEAWIGIPSDPYDAAARHYLYSLPFREPNLVLNSDDLMPASVTLGPGATVTVTGQDGDNVSLTCPSMSQLKVNITLYPKGFSTFVVARRNNDGSTDFTGSIPLNRLAGCNCDRILEIPVLHVQGGWEAKVPILTQPAR